MDPRTSWQRFRGHPTWLQVTAWLVAWPVLGALVVWRTGPERAIVRAGAATVLLVGGVLWLSALAGAAGTDGRSAGTDVEPGGDTAAAPAPRSPEPTDAGTASPRADQPVPSPAAPTTPTVAPSPTPARSQTATPGPNAVATWTVTYIVDGDTLDVIGPGRTEERIRVIGIDTPERGECGFGEAADALAGLVLGREVELVPGAVDDRDRYGRLLRYVDVEGTDAGLVLIEEGLAIARYDSRDGYGRHPREDRYVARDAVSDQICAVPLPSPTAEPAPPPPPADTPDEPIASNP